MRDSTLDYISAYIQNEKVKKQSQEKMPLPKRDKEGVAVHS